MSWHPRFAAALQAKKDAAIVGRSFARSWRARMKPVFDRMDAQGAFIDSPLRHPELRA